MLILASNSPRRKEIMELVGLKFKVIPSSYDENPNDWPKEIEKIPEVLAINKATDVSLNNPNDIVIGSDTIVVINDCILGKPHSKEDAFEMLKKLSGNTHKVITGVCIKSSEKIVSFSSVSEVEFYDIEDAEIYEYIGTNEPMDKAGAYAIQGKGAKFIKSINGDYYTIVGLPIAQILRELKNFQ